MIKIFVRVLAALIYGPVSFIQQSKNDFLEKAKENGKISWFVEMAKAKEQTDRLVGSIFADSPVSRN